MSHTAYEGIADALSKFSGTPGETVKVLGLAVKYYKLAYNRADNEGSMASLPALNKSIAETYKDMGDYDGALVFFQKQLDLDKGNDKALCSTLSNIASVRESLKSSYQQVLQPLLEWEESAEKINSVGQQVMALQEMVRVQELDRREREARDNREKIIKLGGPLDVNEPSSQGSGVSDNFPNIDLEMLEIPTIRAEETRRTLAMFNNRNAKGEYPLHIKLQKSGQESEVLSMIELGHPLEVEDNDGWTPLGVAVGNMNISYVKLLVKAGAKLNHRNEKGESPLMAACAHGWLDGIEFLMESGAKMDLKNKKGESSMAFLRDHVREGKKGKCSDYKLPGVTDRLESALARMENEESKLWCLCNQPQDNRFMVFCANCSDWFHGKCVGINKWKWRVMEEAGQDWTCPECLTGKEISDQSERKRKSTIEVHQEVVTCHMCSNHARKSSIYCSEDCIKTHVDQVYCF